MDKKYYMTLSECWEEMRVGSYLEFYKAWCLKQRT